MNLGVTIARKGSKWEVVTQPDVLFSEQRRGFSALCKKLADSHDEVQLISTSSGRVARRRLKKSAPTGTPPKGNEGGKSLTTANDLV